MSSRPETLGETVAFHAYRTVERLATALPEDWGRAAFRAGALAAFHLAGGARRTVQANLSRVLGRDPEDPLVRAAAQEAFLSYSRYWFDTFRARVMPEPEFLRRMRIEGREHLAAAVEGGRGGVLALPHLGNWDAAGKWVSLQGWRITAVAEQLRPERLFLLFLDHRRGLGMGVVPLYDDRSVGQELVRLIGENHLIALVCDRDLKGRGVRVEMFGEERRMPSGPALLALATGSPLLPCAVYDEGDGWLIRVDPPLQVERTEDLRADVAALTRELARHFEEAISAAPTQWHMFQPAWEDGAALSAGAAAAGAGAAAPSPPAQAGA
ncbi:MAG TPA: phosphatidylinositol mannoside acyltransferase [Actinomycetota bacterium]|nr:phosphatidylinositol mannoside acyltransferase [Actinomycetota bacterium]